jgi:hypothetical protein
MFADFAVYLVSPDSGHANHGFIGSMIGRPAEFQFMDTGPWLFYNIQTGEQHTIEYTRPPRIELGVNPESDEETIKRCLQAIPAFSFQMTPALDTSFLPTLMIGQRVPEMSFSRTAIRCICSLPFSRVSFSPDVQALLHHTSVFEAQTSRAFDGIPPPRKSNPRSITEQYKAVAESLPLQEEMILPCQTGVELGESYGVCLLVKDLGASRFLCKVFLDKPTVLRPGTRLTRKVTYKVPRSMNELEFTSDVAIIDQML